MPTVLRIGACRFFFFAGDRYEPAHIHIERDDNFSRNEIAKIQKIVLENQQLLLESWNAYFNN